MKPLLHVVRLERNPILQQLQAEEALLRADSRNWCLLNRGSPPAIVMGISGKAEQLIRLDKLQESPIPLIRRYSGGGTVVVDENTWFVTFICQADAIKALPYPKHLMRWSAELYKPLFATHSFELRENDYVIGEHKWGGNAQCIIKGRWVHHTSMLWDYHPERMDYLLPPTKAPAYRQGRAHGDFLCRLRDYWPDHTAFHGELLKELGQQFHLVEMDEEVLNHVQSVPHRKSTCLINPKS